MRSNETHIIEKVFVEVETNTSAKAHDIRVGSSSFLQQNVFEYVEAYVAEVEKKLKGVTVHLERIDLDLPHAEGTIARLEQEEAVRKQLDAIFLPILQAIQRGETSVRTQGVKIVSKEAAAEQTTSLQQSYELLDGDTRTVKSILHFVKTGRAPWWIQKHQELRDMLEPEQIKRLLESNPGQFIEQLIQLLQRPKPRRRMLRQFSESLVLDVLKAVIKRRKEVGETFALAPISAEASTFEQLIATLSPTETFQFLEFVVATITGTTSKEEEQKAVKHYFERAKANVPFESQLIALVPTLKAEITADKKDAPLQEESAPEPEEPTSSFDGVLTENAGLVLLNPYFKRFFNNIGLLKENGQLNDPVLAAHILHYLATGEEEDFEFSLLFEAYLCGLPLDEPLPKSVPLTEEIKQNCNELLLAVLGHWTALKSKSPTLLQKEFLQRTGKLIEDDMTPRIVIERTTIDILLNKLPWSLSILKLPWKDQMIYVEW